MYEGHSGMYVLYETFICLKKVFVVLILIPMISIYYSSNYFNENESVWLEFFFFDAWVENILGDSCENNNTTIFKVSYLKGIGCQNTLIEPSPVRLSDLRKPSMKWRSHS